MTQTLSLSDPLATELWNHAQVDGPVTFSDDLQRTITGGLTPTEPPIEPPVIVPPGEVPPIPGSIAPYSHVVPVPWKWGEAGPIFTTYYDGAIGATGVLVCSFVPQLVEPILTGLVSLGVIPGNQHACYRTISVSTVAGDLNGPSVVYKIFDQNPSLYFQVGGSSRQAAVLRPGVPYFINVANVDNNGAWTVPSDETRVEFRFNVAPPYHP